MLAVTAWQFFLSSERGLTASFFTWPRKSAAGRGDSPVWPSVGMLHAVPDRSRVASPVDRLLAEETVWGKGRQQGRGGLGGISGWIWLQRTLALWAQSREGKAANQWLLRPRLLSLRFSSPGGAARPDESMSPPRSGRGPAAAPSRALSISHPALLWGAPRVWSAASEVVGTTEDGWKQHQ